MACIVTCVWIRWVQGIILSRYNITAYQINDQNILERVHLISILLFSQLLLYLTMHYIFYVNIDRNRWRDIRCSKQQRDVNVKYGGMWILVYFSKDEINQRLPNINIIIELFLDSIYCIYECIKNYRQTYHNALTRMIPFSCNFCCIHICNKCNLNSIQCLSMHCPWI